jgi:D-lactate dehydrogenase
MKLAVFSTKSYDRHYLSEALNTKYASSDIETTFYPIPLSDETVDLAKGLDAVCCFVNDTIDTTVVEKLSEGGVKAILMRCAGYNNIDLEKAEELDIFVANVPAYSPEAVAEFAVALIQTLNRKTHRAYNRVREGNFNLEGLLGHTLHGKTVGVVGTGRIGLALAQIMAGFGCKVLGHDVVQSNDFKIVGGYVELDDLLAQSDIVSLHCPLLESTHHLINDASLAKMKKGAMLVNTSRGGLVDTKAVIRALKSKQLGGLGLDVYEGEKEIFYNDHSGEIVDDDEFMRLTTFHNVLVCGHQAFFTHEALQEISDVTLQNLEDFMTGRPCRNNLIKAGKAVPRRGTGPPRH